MIILMVARVNEETATVRQYTRYNTCRYHVISPTQESQQDAPAGR